MYFVVLSQESSVPVVSIGFLQILVLLNWLADNLKDLLRFLRRDDPQSREVFKQVCKWNIVGKDLIPIFEHCQDDRNLVLNVGSFSIIDSLHVFQ